MSTRIDKYIANQGFCSRRKVAEFLEKHSVSISGKRITEPGERFDPATQELKIDGKPFKNPELVYFLVDKPEGFVSTVSDEHKRSTVLDLLPKKLVDEYRIYPVGRLDIESTGLVLLTNDGDLAYQLTHPKFHHPKTYHVKIAGRVKSRYIDLMRNGVRLKDGVTSPAKVEKLVTETDFTILEITLYEGRNRQIRRMCKALNLEVIGLHRVAIGKATIDMLEDVSYLKVDKATIV